MKRKKIDKPNVIGNTFICNTFKIAFYIVNISYLKLLLELKVLLGFLSAH